MPTSPGQAKDWERTQQTTFLRWCNMQLSRAGYGEIENVGGDLRDGIKLVHLVSSVCKKKPPRYCANSPNKLQSIENVNVSLKMLQDDGMQLKGIGPEDVVDGNTKLLLGLLWQMILRYAISEIKEAGADAKQGLLLWCQRKTSGYRNVSVLDFSTSWESGLALCALLNHYRPDLIDFDKLDESLAEENIELVLKLAEEEVGIPRLVDVDTVCFSSDERSLVTYLAYFYHAFSGLEGVEFAGKNIARFHGMLSSVIRMRREYETRVTTLSASIGHLIERWGCAELDNYLVIATEYQNFLKYRKEQRRQWIAERVAVGELLGTIRIKLAVNGMRQYEPPAGSEISDLNRVWSQLLDAERKYISEITSRLRRYKDEARTNFATEANQMAEALTSVALDIARVEDGEFSRQLEAISATSAQLNLLTTLLERIREADIRCRELGVGENDLTTHSVQSLEYELQVTKRAVSNKLASIEKQITARSVAGASHALLDEFEVVFRHFDTHGHSYLSQQEFIDALASLGHTFSSSEQEEKIFKKVSDSKGRCNFRNFIEHLVSVSNLNQTPPQILKSFEEIADHKDYLTRKDLENALLAESDIDSLLEDLPKLGFAEDDQDEAEERYDFKAYLQQNRLQN